MTDNAVDILSSALTGEAWSGSSIASHAVSSLYLLLDACKSGDKCIYPHDRSYLPTDTKAAWWEDGARVAEIRVQIDQMKEQAKEKRGKREEREKNRTAKGKNGKKEASKDKKWKNKNKNRRGPGHVRDGSMGSFGAPEFSPSQHLVFPVGLGLGLPWIGGFASPGTFAGGGGGFAGFSQYDIEELAAQGVKPWDEDAHDVLAALR
ncbi:hypothetical protein FB45DRAFT_1035005 [Roridomyces roridus]|uniref:C3H1-type domain-containing protein n=1 Tax=Roridomyces roridus TaxID=1738132 RepID=A0AAD7BAY9_9AGAR|nr:hypothetical protein FB45DRAFT_1035005 [Roridomyces roridus]